MSLREQTHEAVHAGDLDAIERLVAGNRRALRYLLGFTYHADEQLRSVAARGVALAARHHPEFVLEQARRLVWAMNDESGTNALSAPAVITAIAEEQPELLLPLVPDLARLAADEGLREGLAKALREVQARCPGQVGRRMADILNQQIVDGDCCGADPRK